jgi:hypothetical protein
MNRLRVLSMLLGVLVAGPCAAAEPSLCKSVCDSDKRECRAHARNVVDNERTLLVAMPEKNPMARTAQGQVGSEASRALEGAGDQGRRVARAGACDDTYLRCTRSCAGSAVQPPLAR